MTKKNLKEEQLNQVTGGTIDNTTVNANGGFIFGTTEETPVGAINVMDNAIAGDVTNGGGAIYNQIGGVEGSVTPGSNLTPGLRLIK